MTIKRVEADPTPHDYPNNPHVKHYCISGGGLIFDRHLKWPDQVEQLRHPLATAYFSACYYTEAATYGVAMAWLNRRVNQPFEIHGFEVLPHAKEYDTIGKLYDAFRVASIQANVKPNRTGLWIPHAGLVRYADPIILDLSYLDNLQLEDCPDTVWEHWLRYTGQGDDPVPREKQLKLRLPQMDDMWFAQRAAAILLHACFYKTPADRGFHRNKPLALDRG